MGRKNINHREDPVRNRLYRIWDHMKRRCSAKYGICYRNYAARGITVCEEWLHDFQAFCEWSLSNGYQQGLSIDRIDNNRGYSPDNCRWATMFVQSNNKRDNRLLTLNGETHTCMEWSKIVGMNVFAIYRRLNSGWSDEDALTIPKMRGRSYKQNITGKELRTIMDSAIQKGVCSGPYDFAKKVGISICCLYKTLHDNGVRRQCTIDKIIEFKKKMEER